MAGLLVENKLNTILQEVVVVNLVNIPAFA
jgi:hypothetical protein